MPSACRQKAAAAAAIAGGGAAGAEAGAAAGASAGAAAGAAANDAGANDAGASVGSLSAESADVAASVAGEVANAAKFWNAHSAFASRSFGAGKTQRPEPRLLRTAGGRGFGARHERQSANMRRLLCRHAPHRHDCGANAGDSSTPRGALGGDGRRRRAGGGSDDAASSSSARFEGRSDGGDDATASEGVGAGPGDALLAASALGWDVGGGESRGAMAAGAG